MTDKMSTTEECTMMKVDDTVATHIDAKRPREGSDYVSDDSELTYVMNFRFYEFYIRYCTLWIRDMIVILHLCHHHISGVTRIKMCFRFLFCDTQFKASVKNSTCLIDAAVSTETCFFLFFTNRTFRKCIVLLPSPTDWVASWLKQLLTALSCDLWC